MKAYSEEKLDLIYILEEPFSLVCLGQTVIRDKNENRKGYSNYPGNGKWWLGPAQQQSRSEAGYIFKVKMK